MPVPALKISEYVAKLNTVIKDGRRLGDIDRYEITRAIDAGMGYDPVCALILQALLASVDGDAASVMRCFEEAVQIAPNSLDVHANYAVLLANHGYPEKASQEIRESLALCKQQNDWIFIDSLIVTAVDIGDMDAAADIIHAAAQMGIFSPVLSQAATLLNIDGENDEKAVAGLQAALPGDDLPAASKISDERWAEMKKFADELSQYVD